MKINGFFIQAFLVGVLISFIYGIWAIQPQPGDEWSSPVSKIFQKHALPSTGQRVRYLFSSYNYFITSPFSLLKPHSLLTAVFMVLIGWALLGSETIIIRFFLTLLIVLGFPYLGHIASWNVVASQYTLSLLWMVLWYLILKNCQNMNGVLWNRLFLLFVMSFIASVWHEVWLISFFPISLYVVMDWFMHYRKDQKRTGIMLAVVAGYILALWFYTRGGPEVFISKRTDNIFSLPKLLSLQHIIKSFLMGMKETFVLLKDCIPLFSLMMFIRLKKNFQPQLPNATGLWGTASLGGVLFVFVSCFLLGPPHWRTRCLCIFPILLMMYTFPQQAFLRFCDQLKITPPKAIFLRKVFLTIAVVLLSYNTYRTYIYTNIDVKSWLMYRQMVVDRDPRALKGLCPRTIPNDRPKGTAFWDHTWGAQDDRYRYFYALPFWQIKQAVETYWSASKH